MKINSKSKKKPSQRHNITRSLTIMILCDGNFEKITNNVRILEFCDESVFAGGYNYDNPPRSQ